MVNLFSKPGNALAKIPRLGGKGNGSDLHATALDAFSGPTKCMRDEASVDLWRPPPSLAFYSTCSAVFLAQYESLARLIFPLQGESNNIPIIPSWRHD